MNSGPELSVSAEPQNTAPTIIHHILASSCPLEAAREVMHRSAKIVQQVLADSLPPGSAYTLEDKFVAVEGGRIRVRVVIPSTEGDQTFPVYVWCHSGAFALGDIEMDDYALRKISVGLQVVTVNIDYRLAPEHPFPVGLTDSLTALKWTVQNAASIRVDTAKGVIVGGDSAGGNLAASVGYLARDDPFFENYPVTGLLLREPLLISTDAYPDYIKENLLSYDEFQDCPMLPRASFLLMKGERLNQMRKALSNDEQNELEWYKAPPTDLRYSTLLHPSHAGLAPTFIQYNGSDPLRDDARILEKLIREAGGKVKAIFYPGVPHGFHYFTPRIPLVQKVWRDTEEGIKWLLAGAP